MSKSVKLTTLDLLVSISGMLEAEHYPQLGPMIWHECLLDHNGPTAASVSRQQIKHGSHISHIYLGLLPLHAVC